MALQAVLIEQIERNERNIEQYKKRLIGLPRGSIRERKRNGKVYYYCRYRDSITGKVKDDYIKKEDLDDIRYALTKRKRIEETIKSLQADIVIAKKGLR
jgi:hypothetical protein